MAYSSRPSPVPRDKGGSYTPPEEMPEEGLQVRRFVMKEKVADMMRYCLPIVDQFPRRNRKIADSIKESVIDLYRYAVRLEKKYYKKTTLEDMDIELATLKELIILASDKSFTGERYAPPLTMKQREVWSRYTTEIGKMIGGYKKFVDQKSKN